MRAQTLVLLACLAAIVAADLAPLHTLTDSIPGRYIVKLKAGESVGTSVAYIPRAKILYQYESVFSGFAAELDETMVKRLRSSSAVEYVQEDGVVRAQSVASWGLDRIDQRGLPLDGVFQPFTGEGRFVDVYVFDSGINYGHQEFENRVSFEYDAIGGNGTDCNGHGTHCAGTIAGRTYGVATSANIRVVRVLDCSGSGTWSGLISACEWVGNHTTGPSVASMSIGGGGNQATDDAIEYLTDSGITVVVSAGNDDYYACNKSPARVPSAITVGATDSGDIRAYFSNFGSCVDIFAPGVSITSAWIGGSDATNTISGTSMACPHVAGAAALVLSRERRLTPAEVTNILLLNATSNVVTDPQGSPNRLLYVGTDCGGHFTSTSGSFTSPNYPSSYDNYGDCEYLFDAPEGSVVVVEFNAFRLENCGASCPCDSVSIYDGNNPFAPLLGRWCSTTSPGTVQSSGNGLFIKFVSDGSVTYTGFSATYYFTSANADVTCDSTSMTVLLARSMLHGDTQASEVHFEDEYCTGYDHDPSHVAVYTRYDRCNTRMEEAEREIIYSNTVTYYSSRPINGTEITREQHLKMPVQCRLDRRRLLGDFFVPKIGVITFSEEGFGNFTISLDRYPDGSFNHPVVDREAEVTLGDRLYFAANLTSVSGLTIFIEDCWATPEPRADADKRYDFLENGCPQDPTMQMLSHYDPSFEPFQIDAFAFIEENPQVFVHCMVLVCDDDPSSRCAQGCQSRVRRSELQARGSSSTPHLVSNGPLSTANAHFSKMTGQTAGGRSSGLIFGLFIGLLVCIALVIVAMATVFVVMRSSPRRSQQYVYQRVDNACDYEDDKTFEE